MRDDAFKKINSWKGKHPFCFSAKVLRILSLFGILRLSFYKLHKLQKLQEIEKGCGKLIIKKWNDHHYIYLSKNIRGK